MSYDIPTMSLMNALSVFLDEDEPRNHILDQLHTHTGTPRAQNYGKTVPGTNLPYSQYYDRIDSGWSPEDARGSKPLSALGQIGQALGGFLESKNPVEVASLAPVIGDVAGLAHDAYVLKTEPEQRTLLNYMLAGAGALPFVPSGLGTISKAGNAGIQQGKYTSEAESLGMGHHDPSTFSTLNQPMPMLMRELPEAQPLQKLSDKNFSDIGLYSRLGQAMSEIAAKPGQAETTTVTDFYKKLKARGVTDQEIAESGFDFNKHLNDRGNINILDALMDFRYKSDFDNLNAWTFSSDSGSGMHARYNPRYMSWGDDIEDAMSYPAENGLYRFTRNGKEYSIERSSDGEEYVLTDLATNEQIGAAESLDDVARQVAYSEDHAQSGRQPVYFRSIYQSDNIRPKSQEERVFAHADMDSQYDHHYDGQLRVGGGYEDGYIAHARTSGRIHMANGEQELVRHIDEIQSDIHQAGQRFGYRAPMDAQLYHDLGNQIYDSQLQLDAHKRAYIKDRKSVSADDYRSDTRNLRELAGADPYADMGAMDQELETLEAYSREYGGLTDADLADFWADKALVSPNMIDTENFDRFKKLSKRLSEMRFKHPSLELARKEKAKLVDLALKRFGATSPPLKMPMSGDTWIKSMINDSIQRAAQRGEDWVSLTTADQQVAIWGEQYRKAYEHTYDQKGVAQLKKIARELGAEFKHITLRPGGLGLRKGEKPMKVPAIRLTPEIREKLIKRGLPLYGKAVSNQDFAGHV